MSTVTSPGRILVVEDEPMVAEVVERYLRRDGYDVDVVHDGAAALLAFDTFRPDLMVLDLMLPELDGMEVSVSCGAEPRRRLSCLRRAGKRSIS
jgi:DNA-binding response OmpR family regulator